MGLLHVFTRRSIWTYQNFGMGSCQWSRDTCLYAAHNGNLDTLKWAYYNGCEIRIGECTSFAKKEGHAKVVEWLRLSETEKKDAEVEWHRNYTP